MIISKRSIEQNNVDNFTTKALILSVNVFIFCTKVLIEVLILTSSNADGTAILRGHPNHAKVLPVCRTKAVSSFLSYFKTLSIVPVREVEPTTSCSAVKRSTDWVMNPATMG